jgi:hypothetical protein
MTPLFSSYVCDWCDGLKKIEARSRGYIVWSGGEGLEHYVFPSPEDAERYMAAVGIAAQEIREVLSEDEFIWHRSRGTARDFILAKHRYTVWTTSRFPAGKHDAWLAEEDQIELLFKSAAP